MHLPFPAPSAREPRPRTSIPCAGHATAAGTQCSTAGWQFCCSSTIFSQLYPALVTFTWLTRYKCLKCTPWDIPVELPITIFCWRWKWFQHMNTNSLQMFFWERTKLDNLTKFDNFFLLMLILHTTMIVQWLIRNIYPKYLKVQIQAVTEKTKQNNLLFIIHTGERSSEMLSNSKSST